MKFPILLCAIACLVSCQTIDGKRKYIGPSITGTVSFNGIGLGLTLWNGVDKPAADVVTAIENFTQKAGIPLNTK